MTAPVYLARQYPNAKLAFTGGSGRFSHQIRSSLRRFIS
jgi:hypothetical protein